MNFKLRWCTCVTVTFTLLSLFISFNTLFFSTSCTQCNETSCNTTKFVHEAGNYIKQDGWVRDCITWDRRHIIRPVNHMILRDFVANSTTGESTEKRKATFQKIFDSRDWPADDPSYRGLKASGPGAMLRRAQGVIAILHSVVGHLRTYLSSDFISLLDIPCGDLQWMTSFLDSRPDVVYTGADIVPDIIEHHRKKFSRFNNATFIIQDVVDSMPNKGYDLVLVRDMLQHLWIADAMKALDRISISGSSFLLATTFTATAVNEDVDRTALGGRKSEYNLELPPFSLEPPICISYDWNIEKLALWKLPLKQKV